MTGLQTKEFIREESDGSKTITYATVRLKHTIVKVQRLLIKNKKLKSTIFMGLS